MARDPKRLRKAYEFKLGKDRAKKLSDEQISLVSKYYNSLPEDEQKKIDNSLFQGRSDNDLIEMVNSFIEENEESSTDSDFVEEVNEKLDSNLRGVNEDILGKIDELIAGYEKKVKEGPRKTSTALAVYEGDKEKDEDLVSEEVDERILSLLGLEDAIDIDKGTYKSLLKEKMIEGRMGKTTLSTEDNELLVNEYKRVKNDTGVFKVKKKISASDFNEGSTASTKSSVKVGRSLLPNLKNVDEKIEETVEEGKKKGTKNQTQIAELKSFITKTLAPSLKSIEKNLASIVATMNKQVVLEEKEDEKERVAAEKAKKRTRESKMEGGGLGDKLMAPIKKVGEKAKGLLGMLWDFISNILIGGFLIGLLEIIKDPNKWLNGIIDWINGIIDWIDSGLKALLKPFLDGANNIVAAINLAGNGLQNAVNGALNILGQDPVEFFKDVPDFEMPENILPRIDRLPEKGEQKEEKTDVKGYEGGGIISAPSINIGDVSYAGGGPIGKSSGITINGMGKDTQLIAAQPGEIVMSKGAVNYYGADNLLNMNLQGGGTNQPKSGKIQGFAGGGMVGNKSKPKPKGQGPGWLQKIHKGVKNLFGGGGGSKPNKGGKPSTGGGFSRSRVRNRRSTSTTPVVPKKNTSGQGISPSTTRRSTSTTPIVPKGGTSKTKRRNSPSTTRGRVRNRRSTSPTPKLNGGKVTPQTPIMGGGKGKGGGEHYGPGGARPKHKFGRNLAKLLGMYESGNRGPYTEAYKDAVGIPTIGHGATYYPEGFRLKGKVKMGDTITPEEAMMIKEQHITEHRQRLLKEIPEKTYNALPDNVKAGLESMVFNYGSLRGAHKGLAQIVMDSHKKGDYSPIASVFRNKLARHNSGMNAWRRNDEANIIEKGFSERKGFDKIYFETESTTSTPTQAQVKPQSIAQVSQQRVPSQLPTVPSTPRGQRGITIAALPVSMGGSSSGASGAVASQKEVPYFPSMDPNNPDLLGVKSIYNVTDV